MYVDYMFILLRMLALSQFKPSKFIHRKTNHHSISIYSHTLIKSRVGDDGVPAILQYRPSDLYLTDRNVRDV